MTTSRRGREVSAWIRTKSLLFGLVLLAGMAAGLLPAATPQARAADTFIVDQTADASDIDVGDGDCDVSSSGVGFNCSLRAAIQEANASPGPDLIRFFIQEGTSGGVKTLDVGTNALGPLPPMTDPVTIDGYTQPGASPNTKALGNDAVLKIELKGNNVPDATGLEITNISGTSVVKGLVINRFREGISINADTAGNRIEGNFVGTDPTGTLDRGNTHDGVSISNVASENVIGGTTPAARNVISGNDDNGVFVENANVNKIQGNYLGTDKGGTKSIGNGFAGVFFNDAFGNAVGGKTAASRNVISGNDTHGVFIQASDGTEVLGNRIGTTANGTGALGNANEGVLFNGASDGTVGDGTSGGSNTIAFNDANGIALIGGSSEDLIWRNSIFSNGGLGIDLSGGVENASGSTANDPGDTDSGPNGLQNKPVLSSAKTALGKTTINGKLASTPNRGFLVQFYSNPSGNEGKKFIGEKFITTNGSGNASFSFSPATKVALGQTITATASGDRNGLGGTSEFSSPKKVVAS